MGTNYVVTIETAYGRVSLSAEAAKVQETFDIAYRTKEHLGHAFVEDVAAIRDGDKTIEQLREECLEGADPEYVQGWNEWVDAVEAVASNDEMWPDPVEPTA